VPPPEILAALRASSGECSMTEDLDDLVGLVPAEVSVNSDLELGAIALSVPVAGIEMVLSPQSAIDLVLKLVASIDRVQRQGDGS
jgi:hypothetical protein